MSPLLEDAPPVHFTVNAAVDAPLLPENEALLVAGVPASEYAEKVPVSDEFFDGAQLPLSQSPLLDGSAMLENEEQLMLYGLCVGETFPDEEADAGGGDAGAALLERDAPRGYVDADTPLGGTVGDMLLHKDILAPLPAVNTVLCDIAFPVSSCFDTDSAGKDKLPLDLVTSRLQQRAAVAARKCAAAEAAMLGDPP